MAKVLNNHIEIVQLLTRKKFHKKRYPQKIEDIFKYYYQ